MALADGGGGCYGGGGGVGGGKSPPPLSSTTQLPKQSKEAEKTEFKPKEVNEEEEEQQQTKAVNFKGGNFERSSSSSSSTVVRTPAAELVHIKKESTDDVVILEDDHFDGGKDNFGSFSSSSSMAVPKPMEGLYEAGPPPFLSKTFQMVDDPETDSIVSWGEARQSFIVWDHYELSKTLLPKYFKHNNFSSFIRQLNTYGFKKVDPDMWEFANEAFQGGKKHLLKNIKRRSRYYRQQPTVVVSADPTKAGLEAQIELLMKDHDFLKLEILNLRQQQMYSQHQISAFEERIRSSECKQQRMLLFLTKTATNHALVRQLAHKRVLKREIDGGDLGKSRRLPPAQDLESYREWNDSSHNVGSRNQLQDELVSMQSVLAEQMAEPMANQQNKTPFSAPIVDESCSAAQDAKCPVTDGASKEEIPSAYDDGMSTKFLEENLVFDDEFEVNDSNFYQELEDLIAKPRDWTRYVSNYLVEQPGCVG